MAKRLPGLSRGRKWTVEVGDGPKGYVRLQLRGGQRYRIDLTPSVARQAAIELLVEAQVANEGAAPPT